MVRVCRRCSHRNDTGKPLKSLTVESETDEASFPWTDKKASDMQSNITVTGNKITGTLKYIEDGLSPSGPLSGSGYFMALKWSNPDAAATSLKVGLQPSEGTGLVEAIDDPDHNGVFKVADKDQKLILWQTNATKSTKQVFDLTGLTFEDTGV